MTSLNIPLLMVVAFLLFTLAVGFYFSRKTTTFREYAVGNKQFATATLVATMLATNFGGGGLVREVEKIHDIGLYWIIFLIFDSSFCIWIISRLAVRMRPFMKHLSMAETIGHVYGKYPRIITAISNICRSIVSLSIQIVVISKTISICVGPVDSGEITILATLILIAYSAFGGIRSVTFTDVLQFLTFSMIIPLLAWFVFIKTEIPISEVIASLQRRGKFQFSTVLHFDTKLAAIVSLILSGIVYYIKPTTIQRLYMASDPLQAQKVFSYGSIFSLLIEGCIILVGLFIFVGTPDLPKEKIWPYIMHNIPPTFKGCFSISLLAMSMSTADSYLNSCAVMVSHDIVGSIRGVKKTLYIYQIRVARLTTIVIGLCAMCVAFWCRDLLKLMFLAIDFSIPIVTAPFILSVFGFRGTSRTALIGMATGTLAILVWSKWVEPLDPEIGIDGAFSCMLANGLAMMAAHYFLKQPKGTGWVKPDSIFTQIKQENARKRAERRETIKNVWVNRKVILANLVPSHTTIVYIGCYTTVTSLLAYFIEHITHHGSWLILQLFVSTCFLGYPFIYDISKKIRLIPAWSIGLCWLIGLTLYLPLNLFWHSWNAENSIFTTSLSLAHCAVILWVLPLYLGIAGLVLTLLVVIYPTSNGLPYPVLCSLLPTFIFILIMFLFTIIICLKVNLGNCMKQVRYLKNQEEIRASQQLKAFLYDVALVPSNGAAPPKGYGFILNQVVRKVEESISFLDNHTPLFKEDLQSIINKFYDWIIYFNRREKAKDHALLQPDKITLEKLIRKVEIALSQEVAAPPKLLVETTSLPNGEPCLDMVCDIHQVVYSLVKSILRIGKLEGPNVPIISIQLYATSLQFKRADPIDSSHAAFIDFQATALVISQATIDSGALLKVKEVYNDTIDATEAQGKKKVLPSIDLEQDTISTIVRAHYGYLEVSIDSQHPTMLLVFPSNVTDILDNMTVELPLDCLTSEGLATPKEQANSMMALMRFHDYICKASHAEDPIDIKIISGLLLLLRQHFGFKRHASGQLFYVRAVGITELVIEWVFHSPKVIYASLLYELVRHTCLPISYIKEHYNLGVYAFVLNVIGIDKRQDLDHPSLLYVQNRLKEAIKEDHVQLSVLFIKLAERLYDLRHAAGYIHLQEVAHMAKETLAIDVRLANEYLGPEIGKLLEKAAKQALEDCKNKENSKRKDKDS